MLDDGSRGVAEVTRADLCLHVRPKVVMNGLGESLQGLHDEGDARVAGDPAPDRSGLISLRAVCQASEAVDELKQAGKLSKCHVLADDVVQDLHPFHERLALLFEAFERAGVPVGWGWGEQPSI